MRLIRFIHEQMTYPITKLEANKQEVFPERQDDNERKDEQDQMSVRGITTTAVG